MEEYWDVYDRFRRKNGKVIKRDSDQWLQDGEYHIVVTGIIENANNQILISRRKDDKKSYPGLWECTGGSVQIEETSIQAIIREVYEEIGIELTYRDPFEPGLAREIKLDAETISGSIFTEEFFKEEQLIIN